MFRGFSAWQSSLADAKRQRHVLKTTLYRMQHRELLGGVLTWRSALGARRSVRRAMAHWQNQRLAGAMERWETMVGESKRTRLVLGRTLSRMWGRDVMLYTGGVSFFIMLAIFPAIAIAMGLYSLLSDPARVAEQGEALARVMPDAARLILQSEMVRLSQAPGGSISIQSGVALVVGAPPAWSAAARVCSRPRAVRHLLLTCAWAQRGGPVLWASAGSAWD